jgi:hypothetical protein
MINSQVYQNGFVPLHPDLSSSGYQIYIKPEALEFLSERIHDDYASLNLVKK